MVIALSTTGKNLESELDSRFGRAQGFILYNSDNLEWKYFDNVQNLDAIQGAGIQSAKNVINAGADCVITGHVGPKAFKVLTSVGIEIYTAQGSSLIDIIDQFSRGQLVKLDNPDVEGHW